MATVKPTPAKGGRTTALKSSMRELLQALWVLPCSALACLPAIVLLLAGGQARRVGRVLEIMARPDGLAADSAWSRLPFSAITLGRVILGTCPAELERLRSHELAHVRQYERWGLLFFLAYPAASVRAWLRGQDPYRDNGFEVQARREESRPQGPA